MIHANIKGFFQNFDPSLRNCVLKNAIIIDKIATKIEFLENSVKNRKSPFIMSLIYNNIPASIHGFQWEGFFSILMK